MRFIEHHFPIASKFGMLAPLQENHGVSLMQREMFFPEQRGLYEFYIQSA